jgi:hypothetical protein
LESNGKAIAVRFPAEPADKGCGGVPETFCEHEEGNASVTVQGYVEGTRERPGFVAETIMIKLPRFDLDEPLPRCLPIPLAR